MQEKDNIEEHYRKTFSGFEADAPEHSWEKIRSRLHPEETKGHTGIRGLRTIFRNSPRLYPFLAMAATVLLLALIWFSYSDKHTISGHAYAGDSRMCRGTAFLFKVYDKAKPLDTVLMVQSVPIDEKGFYQFFHIDHGQYLIRVNPLPGSEITKNFLPSYYDQDSASAEANVIHIEKEDPTADIRLIPR